MDPYSLLVDQKYFSEQQKSIIGWRISGESYRDIASHFKERYSKFISQEAICRCISRTSRGLFWEHGMGAGDDPYLCQEDIDSLKLTIDMSDSYFEIHEIIEEAMMIKKRRTLKMTQFLQKINCPNLSFNAKAVDPPTRSWVNKILDEIDANILFPKEIEESRLLCCNEEVVRHFFITHSNSLLNVPDALLFGADETMLECIKKGKIVLPKNRRNLESTMEDIYHITAMCCHNVIGDCPLFYNFIKSF